jgi:hypothetical protein
LKGLSNCSWAFSFNKVPGGWVVWLRNAGRGPQESPKKPTAEGGATKSLGTLRQSRPVPLKSTPIWAGCHPQSHVWDKLSVSPQGCTSELTPFWDDLGYTGRGEGRGRIAGIADIARHRRNRTSKTYHGGTRDTENSEDRKRATREPCR